MFKVGVGCESFKFFNIVILVFSLYFVICILKLIGYCLLLDESFKESKMLVMCEFFVVREVSGICN